MPNCHTVYHDIHRAVKVVTGEDFPGDLANPTGYTALGLVLQRSVIPPIGEADKASVFVVLLHTDYDPSVSL